MNVAIIIKFWISSDDLKAYDFLSYVFLQALCLAYHCYWYHCHFPGVLRRHSAFFSEIQSWWLAPCWAGQLTTNVAWACPPVSVPSPTVWSFPSTKFQRYLFDSWANPLHFARCPKRIVPRFDFFVENYENDAPTNRKNTKCLNTCFREFALIRF